MTKHCITIVCLSVAVSLAACDGAERQAEASEQAKSAEAGVEQEREGDAPELDPKVAKAVGVANDIAANPDASDEILAGAGLDREKFEALLYEIARDPELSKSYAIAREG